MPSIPSNDRTDEDKQHNEHFHTPESHEMTTIKLLRLTVIRSSDRYILLNRIFERIKTLSYRILFYIKGYGNLTLSLP